MREVGALSAAERRNREIVLELYEKAILNWDFEAGKHLLGDRYVQHDPIVADGHEGLRRFIETFSAQHPDVRTEVKHVYVDGDTVMLHVHSTRFASDPGVAIVEIYRVDNDKVVEHWDVIQPIPTEAMHDNGVF